MYIIGNLLLALAQVINLITSIYTFIIAGSVIISWVQADPYNPIVKFLHSATEPIYSKIRKVLPAFLYRSTIDWTPLVVIILLMFLETLIGGTLTDLGNHLRYGVPLH
jgi:YggT family protein